MKKIAFFGGDARTLAAVRYLTRAGYDCVMYEGTGDEGSLVRMRGADAAVFPLPCERNGRLNAPLRPDPPTVAEVWRKAALPPQTPVFSGPIKQAPFCYTDLSAVQALKERNAVTTAEGVLPILIGRTDRSVNGMRCLIVGYGALGKRLAAVLSALGAQVTAAARKEEDRERIRAQGYQSADTARLPMSGFDAVINTVPAPVIGKDAAQSGTPLMIELASPPGGFDPELSGVIRAPGLPGVVAPVTAGEDLAKTLIELWSDLLHP